MLLFYIRCIPAWIIYINSSERKKINKDITSFNFTSFIHAMKNSCFRTVFYSRCRNKSSILLKISKLFLPSKKSLQIEILKEFGEGMNVYHGDSTIVFANSIGKNFTVYQQVTIGRGKRIDGKDTPVIGDNVTVYAGAIIVGGIRIGNNVKIGAGAVVVKDIPDNVTAVGAPIRIIEQNRKETRNE